MSRKQIRKLPTLDITHYAWKNIDSRKDYDMHNLLSRRAAALQEADNCNKRFPRDTTHGQLYNLKMKPRTPDGDQFSMPAIGVRDSLAHVRGIKTLGDVYADVEVRKKRVRPRLGKQKRKKFSNFVDARIGRELEGKFLREQMEERNRITNALIAQVEIETRAKTQTESFNFDFLDRKMTPLERAKLIKGAIQQQTQQHDEKLRVPSVPRAFSCNVFL